MTSVLLIQPTKDAKVQTFFRITPGLMVAISRNGPTNYRFERTDLGISVSNVFRDSWNSALVFPSYEFIIRPGGLVCFNPLTYVEAHNVKAFLEAQHEWLEDYNVEYPYEILQKEIGLPTGNVETEDAPKDPRILARPSKGGFHVVQLSEENWYDVKKFYDLEELSTSSMWSDGFFDILRTKDGSGDVVIGDWIVEDRIRGFTIMNNESFKTLYEVPET